MHLSDDLNHAEGTTQAIEGGWNHVEEEIRADLLFKWNCPLSQWWARYGDHGQSLDIVS